MTLDEADRAIEVMKKGAARMADLPANFATYQKQMADMIANPPWEQDDVGSA